MTNYDEYRVTILYRHILHYFATRFPNMFSFNSPVRQLINTAAPLTCAHTQVSVNKHVWILPASLTLPQVHRCHQNHYDPFNSLAAGRCGYSFNSITFKLIIQNSSLDIHCKLLPDKCHKTKESSAVVQVMVGAMRQLVIAQANVDPGPVFCLLLGVGSDYAQPTTCQVTEVTCPVISWAQPELTPRKRQKTGPDLCLRGASLGHN